MRTRILLATSAALVALVAAFFSCSTVPEKVPIEPGSPAAAYVVELEDGRFRSMNPGRPHRGSPDGKARLDIESHQTLLPVGLSEQLAKKRRLIVKETIAAEKSESCLI